MSGLPIQPNPLWRGKGSACSIHAHHPAYPYLTIEQHDDAAAIRCLIVENFYSCRSNSKYAIVNVVQFRSLPDSIPIMMAWEAA
jgi:hypothetical protein